MDYADLIVLDEKSAVFAKIAKFFGDKAPLGVCVERVNRSPTLLKALSDYQSGGHSIEVSVSVPANSLVYDALTRQLIVHPGILQCPESVVRSLGHAIAGYDRARKCMMSLFDARHVLYLGGNAEHMRNLMTNHVFTWRMLGLIADYRVAKEAGIEIAPLWPAMGDDMDVAGHIIQRQLGNHASAEIGSLAVAHYLSAKDRDSDPYFASLCAEWARIVVESAQQPPLFPIQRLCAGFSLAAAGSCFHLLWDSYEIKCASAQWDSVEIVINNRMGETQSISRSKTFEDGSRFLIRNDLAADVVTTAVFDVRGTGLRSSTYRSACDDSLADRRPRETAPGCFTYA